MEQKRFILYADSVEDFKAQLGIKVQEALEGQDAFPGLSEQDLSDTQSILGDVERDIESAKDDADNAIRAADEAIGTLNTLGDTLENLKSSVGDAVNIDDVTLDITSKLVSMMVVEETPPPPSQFDVTVLLGYITALKDSIADIEAVVRNLDKPEWGTESD